jgi:putative copper resistance protein D
MDDAFQLVLRGACRGLHLAGYFSCFGAMFLSDVVLQGAAVRGLRSLAWAGFGLALLAGLAWFALQTAYFASVQTVAGVVEAAPIVALYTYFGRLLLGRMAVLLLAALLFQYNCRRPAAVLAFCGVVAEAWLGHGGAMTGLLGDVLLGTAVLHLAAAALWLGTLPALSLALSRLPDPGVLARRYSPLGSACVAVLLLTAAIQYILLIARPAALINSGYGALAAIKMLLLASLIALAARNRFHLTPALPSSRRALLRAIGAEIMLGMLVLVAAGILLQFAPPAMAGMAAP